VIAQFEVPGETRSLVLHPTLVAVTLSGGSSRFLNGLILIEDTLLLYNQKKCIKYKVGTQLYIITQISTYSYMFRPCILAIVRLYYKLNK